MTASKWQFLDLLSHVEWKYPAYITRQLSKDHEHTSLAQVMLYIEDMENNGYIETQKMEKRLGVRKTRSGIRAQIEAQQNELDTTTDASFKPV